MIKDLISIIIPAYNAEKMIRYTLDSVEEQRYRKLEIIVVNDGSKDNTSEIAKEYAEMDKRIKVIDIPNGGVSNARNTGLENANGEYIMFLDSDDNYTTPNAILNMYKTIKRDKSSMVVCAFTHPGFEMHLKSGVYNMDNKKDFIKYYQDFFAHGMPWNKLFRRECITEKFDVNLHFTEDEIFNLENLHNMKKISVINEVYHNYYCAPYDPQGEASAVNKIFSNADYDFWSGKNTAWYACMNTYPNRVNAIEKYHADKKDDMLFVRSFDLFFWDFSIMLKNHTYEEFMKIALRTIFDEPLFQKSLENKERYGLKLKKYTNEDIDKFTHLATYAFNDIKGHNKKLSMYKVFLCLFGNIFYTAFPILNDMDMLASCFNSMRCNSSPEAAYAKNILRKAKGEEEKKLDKEAFKVGAEQSVEVLSCDEIKQKC